MSHSLLRRCLLVLVALGIMLGPPAAWATPVTWGSLLLEGGNAWTWIGDVLMGQHQPEGTRPKTRYKQPEPLPVPSVKHGCGIDPNGRPYCTP
jgi:hypothetical protein